eukprot:CAMPEP_0197463116 /NCGR_PEP_ID=MMETSP1175-20131217/60962_1 /TAXON_ID=1003142 /ORGANISM="Triceratium dubium, Strain CCMP147" /LENGTH=458 /DNA_ID=CAMNT_0042998795 /DNA_START=100 /DNA_END=1477 /DNA_ORIENTATION=+
MAFFRKSPQSRCLASALVLALFALLVSALVWFTGVGESRLRVDGNNGNSEQEDAPRSANEQSEMGRHRAVDAHISAVNDRHWVIDSNHSAPLPTLDRRTAPLRRLAKKEEKNPGKTGRGLQISIVWSQYIPSSSTTTTTATSSPARNYGDAIVFRPKPLPCTSRSSINAHHPQGIYYVKVQKTNSTHWRDVALESALHKGTELGQSCYIDATHMDVEGSNLRRRDRDRSLLFTFIRDVKEWKVAKYYHELAKVQDAQPSVNGMSTYVMKRDNGQSKYIRTLSSFDDYGVKYGAYTARDIARAILTEYDFVGVVEDPERSLVCYRLLFGLPAKSILYNPSPLAGTISFRSGDKSSCQRVLPNEIYPEVRNIMAGSQWKEENAVDMALYEEAKRSLDATIDLVIGRDTFETALAEHRELMSKVKRRACRECDTGAMNGETTGVLMIALGKGVVATIASIN